MFQKIVESSKVSDIEIHTLEDGTLLAGFELDLFDEEVIGTAQTEQMLLSLIRGLPEGRKLRVYLKSEYANSTDEDHSRKNAISEIGYVKNRAYIFLERKPQMDLTRLFSVKKGQALTDFTLLKDHGIKIRTLDAQDVANILPPIGDEVNHAFQTIDTGTHVLSILRLVKQSEFGMDLTTLSHIKDGLSLPYTICCTVEAVPHSSAETLLRRRSKQNIAGSDLRESRKYSEAQDDLEDISLHGTKIFRFEWQCLLARNDEKSLREDREETKRRLDPLGEIYIESVGALSSLKSFYPGGHTHFSLLERDSTLVTYLPLITRGDAKTEQRIVKRSLALHRKDESLSYLNIFDPNYESFSWCIFGRPGTGKSVLTNAITRALVFDPDIKIIKIDVGGSHSRETEALGGVEKTLNLNEPTGINPFDVLKELGATKEAIQILASFLEVLILEEGEVKLSKTMKSDLERALNEYASLNRPMVDLKDFFNVVDAIPRRELLNRWVGNGVYGNAFAVNESHLKTQTWNNSSLTYFNFSKISQALDPDYAQGGLAAVMAQFNLEMLKKSQTKKRIVFIADETPFFIRKCFSFFNLSIANVRKEGHGFITVAQKSAHVVVDNDTGILDNSPNKIFFSLDGDDESFMARTQLDIHAVAQIKSLRRVQNEFSEAYFKDNRGERVFRIRLSPSEYWSYTSKDEDRQKFQELRAACPSLSIEEIIRCLAV